MSIILLGVNHKTAPVELRERLAISASELSEVTLSLSKTPGVSEAIILSTCNRVELLVQSPIAAPNLVEFFHNRFSIGESSLLPHVYEYREREAVRHLFRVAASLDSMVVGEPQILGQVKEAYATAKAAGAVQSGLEQLLQCAFSAAKRVRSETQIGTSSVSVASIAVDLAEKIFGSLEGKKIFLVGAGKMSELAARHLVKRGASSIFVTNRTQERAIRLAAEFGGHVIRYDDLYSTAHQADIIITSTGSTTPLFRKEHGQGFIHRRKNRPMFLIDIAVPRDVDPGINDVEGVFLYDIDDLQSVAASHMTNRSQEAAAAEEIIEEEVDRYLLRVQALDAAPAIMALQQSAEELRQTELRRLEGRLRGFSAEQRAAVEALTRGMMNKFLHPALKAIKAAAREGDQATVDALRNAFETEKRPVFEPLAGAWIDKGPELPEVEQRARGRRVRTQRPTVIRIGTRGSQLALWQANHIADALRRAGHEAAIELIRTTGDRMQQTAFSEVGTKGMFTKEIEEALAEERIDLAVHSLKDLPTELSPQFTLGAIPKRADARDAFVSRQFGSFSALPRGAKVGTSSLRRQAQLRALRSDLEYIEFRGNVDTRLRKLAEGRAEAIILASAGLDRLEQSNSIRERFSVRQVCPAPGQGALAIECRTGDAATLNAIVFLDHVETRFAVTAERIALNALGGGCQVPIGAFCEKQGDEYVLIGAVAAVDGSLVVRAESSGTDEIELGQAVAQTLLAEGAQGLLSTAYSQ